MKDVSMAKQVDAEHSYDTAVDRLCALATFESNSSLPCL